MTSDPWKKAEELYHAALEREPSEREAFLQEACAGDEALLDEVKSLLGADERAQRFMEEPAGDAATQAVSPDESPLWIGRRVQSYEVLSLLGVGGMGEVYRARDTKLDREVALKVLPQAFADNPERVARFEREAKALAALNHPNVAAIYELEESEGRHVLVLELVEGETLADRIARGPIPIAEALPLFRQIAAGLEAAHEKGIIHRDLKPANVRITPDGQAKVLDFGLAKAFPGVMPAGSDIDTATARATQTGEGRILGTVAYMSPEQARGQAVDKRTDVWAFGCVLYEALTGRRAFKGETVSDTFAAVLERDVDWEALPKRTPSTVRSLLRRCLQKDRDRRLHDIADARIELEEAMAELSHPHATSEAGAGGLRSASRNRRRVIEIAAAALLAGGVGVLATLWLAPPGTDRENPVRRFSFTPANLQDAVISPDGRHIAYVAGVPPVTKLWVQDLDREEPHEIEGTERAWHPFWSPDSAFIGFGAGWELKKVSARGGTPVTVCEFPGPPGDTPWFSGSWSPDGSLIALSTGPKYQRLYEVPARGGRPMLLVKPEEGEERTGFVRPHFLSLEGDAPALVFETWASDENTVEIVVPSLETGERRSLARGTQPIYSPSGHLLYRPSWNSRVLHALPFSLRTLEPLGVAFPVTENASQASDQLGTTVSVSRDGTLVYVDRGPTRQWQLVLRDRAGKRLGLVGLPHDGIAHPRLSPDERQVVATGSQGDVQDVWIHEIARPVATRLTMGEFTRALWPTWAPAGDRVAFTARNERTRDSDIFVKPAGGGGEAKALLATPARERAGDWSRDGRYVVYNIDAYVEEARHQDLWYFELTDGERGSEPVPFLQTPFTERLAKFSPDGRFLAYLSDESGRYEVYVQRFPAGGGKLQVSTGGACQMRWGRNGEIFYVELVRKADREVASGLGPPVDAGRLVAVPMTTAPELSVGRPRRLFESPGLTEYSSPMYDVFADGQRFVVREPVGDRPAATIRVVENWFEEFRDRQARTE